MTIKILMAEHLYETARAALNSNYSYDWQEICARRPSVKKLYEEVAKRLNEDLGICSSCGARPETGLLEVAGEMWCGDCCKPPVDDPKVQCMHMFFNTNNEIIGALTPPAGMSLEAYQAQLQEETTHLSFVLEYDHTFHSAKNISELYQLWCDHIPTPSYEFFIYIKKDEQDTGKGCYECAAHDAFAIISETGAAVGFMDALQEYDYAQTTQEAK